MFKDIYLENNPGLLNLAWIGRNKRLLPEQNRRRFHPHC